MRLKVDLDMQSDGSNKVKVGLEYYKGEKSQWI